MLTSFYNDKELADLGFLAVGKNVRISRKASLYSVNEIQVGDNSRVDDFCIISGKVVIGRYVHLAAYSSIFAPILVRLEDFSGLSARVSVYSGSDHYFSDSLMNPTVPERYRNVVKGRVVIGRFATIGAGSIVLPGVAIGEGCTVGALSLVNKDLDAWWLYAGNPIRRLVARKHEKIEEYIEELERESTIHVESGEDH